MGRVARERTCSVSKKTRSNLLLLLTSLIWGTAFVAQRVSSGVVEPFTFNGVRMMLGGLALIPVIAVTRKNQAKKLSEGESLAPVFTKHNITGGVLCGTLLFFGAYFQQAGVEHTSAGKAGFITALYILLVPILGLFLRKKVSLKVWLAVAMGVVGLYLLSVTEDFTIGKGDLLVLICAFFFSFHILTVDYFSDKSDGIIMSCIQFFVASIISLILMVLTESPSLAAITAMWLPICYSGLISGGVGYTLQIVAQKHTDPTVASLLMSFESVFSVLAGAVLLREILSEREIFGCGLMFVAIVLSQLPSKKTKSLKS